METPGFANILRSAAALVLSATLARGQACDDDHALKVPQQFASIQAAIDAAEEGQCVVVSPGTYHEAINLVGKGITVRGADPEDASVVARTVVDASGLGTSVILCESGETAATVISGLTITGGVGSEDQNGEITGGGIRIFQSSPTISRCRFVENSAVEDGGAIYIDDGSPVIEDCLFMENVAGDDGGAIAIRGNGGMTLISSVFIANGAGDDGGAFRIREGLAFISACTFEDNAAVSGGAMHIHDADASVTVQVSTFCGNAPDAVVGPFVNDGNDFLGGCGSDSDGDGLADVWEIRGVEYVDATGQTQFYILDTSDPRDGISDANPKHKDLFVEVDTMTAVPFTEEARIDVQFAFATAPTPNPDGTEGIDLHIIVDEDDLPFESQTDSVEGEFPPNAGITRLNHFGTPAERAHEDRFFLLEAKAKAYRYGLAFFGSNREIGGHAELGGDDMIMYMGGMSDEEQAAVFMHELGHCLSLHHGGGPGIADEDQRAINGKPNYPSIMNYVLAYREPWNESFWVLDYSRRKLETINESDISELVSVGTGGGGLYDDYFMPFQGIVPFGADCHDDELWGESLISYADLDESVLTDLNLDCDTDDEQFDADLNFVPGSDLPGSEQPSPGEVLEGHDDWAHLVLAVDDGGGLFAGRPPSDELTETQRQYMRDNFPPPPSGCVADWNGDGAVDSRDVLAFLNAWNAGDAAADINGDGYIDTRDVLEFLNSWTAGC